MIPKGRLPLHTSPKGRFRYPHLISPDTKFDKDGRYAVDLLVPSAEAGPFIKKIGALHAEAVEGAEEKFKELKPQVQKKLKEVTVNDFYQEALDDDGEPTGDIMFRFSCKAKGVSRKKGEPQEFMRRIAIFDAKGNPIRDANLQIWGGTLGRVTFVAVPYFIPATAACGVSMRPVAVQIIELVSGGQGKSAKEFGFDEEEGFEHPAPADDAKEPAEAEADPASEVEELEF